MSPCPTCASLWPRSDPADQPDSDPPHAHNMTAILAGTITGSIIFVLLFVGLLFLFHRRRRLLQINSELEAGRITPFRDERVIDISSRPLTIPGNVLPFPHDVVLDISPTSMMRLGIVGSGWNGEDASLSDGGRGGDVTRDLSVGRTLADEAELVRKPRDADDRTTYSASESIDVVPSLSPNISRAVTPFRPQDRAQSPINPKF